MAEQPSIVFSAVFAVIIYFSYKIIRWAVRELNKPPAEIDLDINYMDDEPDGSNYVTMPDGERRLD